MAKPRKLKLLSRSADGPAAAAAPLPPEPRDPVGQPLAGADQQGPPSTAALMAEQTARQASMIPGFAGMPGLSNFISPFIGGGAVTLSNLGSGTSAQWLAGAIGDPYAFGRFIGQFYWGSYGTYRLILAHPRMRQARATLFMPIEAGTWEVEADADVDEKIVDFIRDTFRPLREAYVPDALRACDMGWAPFETIWGPREGYIVPTRLKPLLPDTTTILVDEYGSYAGVQQGCNPSGNFAAANNGAEGHRPDGGTLDAWKSHVYSFDVECGNLYGRPLTENARATAWRDWLDATWQLHGIGEKLSEVIVMGYAPAGTFPDGKGGTGTVTPVDEMKKALAGLKDSGVAVFANLVAMAKPGMSADELRKLAVGAMSGIEFYDAGNHSSAISGQLERRKAAEDLMFASYLLSSRTGMQAMHGSKADADRHSDSGLIVSESLDRKLAVGLQGKVDQTLELNFDRRLRGKVRLRPTPLVDRKAEMFEDVIKAALEDKVVGPAVSEQLDWDAIATRAGVPVKEGADLGGAVATAVAADREQKAKAVRDKGAQGQRGEGEDGAGDGAVPVKIGPAAGRMNGAGNGSNGNGKH